MSSILVENLKYKYDISGFEIKVDRLEIKKGEMVLIVGNSGSGKTTLLYCLSGIIPHCIKRGQLEGSVKISDINVLTTPIEKLIGRIGIVLQNPESQIFGMTVEEDIAFGLENMKLERNEIKKRIEKWLTRLGMYELREEDPESLSGGQKQRLVIASALAMEPEILFLDEPFSNLDIKTINLLIDILKELKNEGKTIIIVERKTDELLSLVDKIIVIKDGNVNTILNKNETEKLIELGII
jgi:energy-coupling factor transport system ATP-binding protein